MLFSVFCSTAEYTSNMGQSWCRFSNLTDLLHILPTKNIKQSVCWYSGGRKKSKWLVIHLSMWVSETTAKLDFDLLAVIAELEVSHFILLYLCTAMCENDLGSSQFGIKCRHKRQKNCSIKMKTSNMDFRFANFSKTTTNSWIYTSNTF